jgi:hypothetical protein
MSYASQHATAYAGIRSAGAAVLVSRVQLGSEAANGTLGAAASSSVAVAALAKASDPVRFRELSLTFEKAVTLFVAPETFGLRAYTDEFIKPNDTLTWNGVTMTVRAVGPLIALDGIVVAGTIIASV